MLPHGSQWASSYAVTQDVWSLCAQCEKAALAYLTVIFPSDAFFFSHGVKWCVFAPLDELRYRKYMPDHPKYRFDALKRSQPSMEMRALTHFWGVFGAPCKQRNA